MTPERFGRAVRALRRRAGMTQAELGARCDLSQAVVSRIECGGGSAYTWATLDRLGAAAGARVAVTLFTNGEDVDRLLDAGHAAIVEWVSAYLRRLGWEVAPEVTFSVYGERGSIDILAFHAPTGSLLVIEVKSVIPDVQATLAGIDRKARLASRIASERGWRVRSVSRWLVVPGDRTTRRRIDRHQTTFAAALPVRTPALKRWAARPGATVAGIFHVPDMNHAGTKSAGDRRRHSKRVTYAGE